MMYFVFSISAENSAGFRAGGGSWCECLGTVIDDVKISQPAAEHMPPSGVAELAESRLNHDRR